MNTRAGYSVHESQLFSCEGTPIAGQVPPAGPDDAGSGVRYQCLGPCSSNCSTKSCTPLRRGRCSPIGQQQRCRWLNVNEFTRPRQRRRGPVGHAQRRPRRPQAAHRWDHVLCDWLVENCRELYSGGSGGSSGGGGGGIFPRFKQTVIHGRLDRQSVCALPQGGAGL